MVLLGITFTTTYSTRSNTRAPITVSMVMVSLQRDNWFNTVPDERCTVKVLYNLESDYWDVPDDVCHGASGTNNWHFIVTGIAIAIAAIVSSAAATLLIIRWIGERLIITVFPCVQGAVAESQRPCRGVCGWFSRSCPVLCLWSRQRGLASRWESLGATFRRFFVGVPFSGNLSMQTKYRSPCRTTSPTDGSPIRSVFLPCKSSTELRSSTNAFSIVIVFILNTSLKKFPKTKLA